MPTPYHPPLAARRALAKLGQDIRDARRKRGLPAEILAERAFTTRPTLRRIEAGDHRVGIGIYAAVLHALGLLDGLKDSADAGTDKVGLALTAQSLPKRIRLRRDRGSVDGR